MVFHINYVFNFQQVWDTGGQERYRPVLATCYKNAFGVILVYDVTNKKTFANLQQWLIEVNEFSSSDLPKLLIGMTNFKDIFTLFKYKIILFYFYFHLAHNI